MFFCKMTVGVVNVCVCEKEKKNILRFLKKLFKNIFGSSNV